MKVERRVAAILGVVALLALPAAVLRILCVGASCEQREAATRTVPFCSLPARTRAALAAGYREGRSPDVMAVTRPGVQVVSGSGRSPVPWPTTGEQPARAAVIFRGTGVRPSDDSPPVDLTDVAPTLAAVAGFKIPHPDVRSGRPVEEIVTGQEPRVVLLIVIDGLEDAGSDPVLKALAAGGVATTAETGSLPSDPAALHATIGTGGIPAEHGITGTTLRNDAGNVSRAWEPSTRPPRSVIATLADDLDEVHRGHPRIGLVADSKTARGLIGGNWYVDNDRDVIDIGPARSAPARVRRILGRGFGADGFVDVMAVSVRATPARGAAPALHLLRVAQRVLGDEMAMAIVALPAPATVVEVVPAGRVSDAVEDSFGRAIVEDDVAGGLFLDQKALAKARITRDDVVRVLRELSVDRRRIFEDVFPATAVAFARFC